MGYNKHLNCPVAANAVKTRNTRVLRKIDFKADAACRKPKELSTDISVLFLYKILERLLNACAKLVRNPLFPRKQAEFRFKKSNEDRVVLLNRTSRILSRLRRRLVQYLLI